MKLIYSVLILTMSLSSLSFARPPSPEKHLEHMTEALDLSDEQRAQIETIMQDQKSKHDELQAQYGIGDEFHQQMREIRKQGKTEIEGVLTAEQKEKFQSMRKGRGKKPRAEHSQG